MLSPETLSAAQAESLTLATELYALYETLADAGVEAEPLSHACDLADELSVTLGNPSLYTEPPAPALVAQVA